jgi:hypothetical protein
MESVKEIAHLASRASEEISDLLVRHAVKIVVDGY